MKEWPLRSEWLGRNLRLLPYILAVLLLPVLVLRHGDGVLFSPPRHTDAWFYLGFFRNLVNFKRDLFPGIYYGGRLAWILPGYLVHRVFSPVAANAILHLAVHSIASLSLFSILRMTAGARSALLGTIVFSLHPWLWAATGWDYVDGAGIAWCLLAMALLTRAAVEPARKSSLLLAGIALAGMIHTTFFLILFAPLLALAYIGMARGSRWQTPLLASSAAFCTWSGAGFAFVTAVLCGVNYLLDGRLAFWSGSVGAASNLAATLRYPQVGVWYDGWPVPWHWFTIVAVLTAAVLLPSRLRQEFKRANAAALLFSADLILAVGAMGYLQYHQMPVLGNYHYAAYLLPFVFLVAGISFWPAVDRMSLGLYVLTCCGAAISTAWWANPDWNVLTLAARHTIVLLAVGALAAGLAMRQRVAGIWLSAAGFAILTVQAGAGTAILHGSRPEYERVMKARESVERLRQGGEVRFWFDDRDPARLDFWALNNTYLAEFSQIGAEFPRRGCEATVDQGTLVVVSSSRNDATEVARRALEDCWSPWGMKPVVQMVNSMQRGNQPYTVTLLRAEPDRARQRSLRVVFDPAGKASLQFADAPGAPPGFPRERWKITPQPADPTTVENSERGIVVRTPRRAYSFAIEFPRLTVPAGGRYRFALRYRLLSGQFAFGARSADDSRYLAEDAKGHPVSGASGEREMAYFVDLKANEEILLRIANNNNSGAGAAAFVIGDVTAVEFQPLSTPVPPARR